MREAEKIESVRAKSETPKTKKLYTTAPAAASAAKRYLACWRNAGKAESCGGAAAWRKRLWLSAQLAA